MKLVSGFLKYLALAALIMITGVALGALMAKASAAPLNNQEVEPVKTVQVPLRTDAYTLRLEAVESYLNKIDTLSGNFIQQAPNGHLSRGKLLLKKPGHVRFEYSDDVPLLIVADGETLNLIDYELSEITKWPVMDTPLAFLLENQIKLDDRVELSFSGTEDIANIISVSASDPKKPEQGTLTLIFESKYKENSDIEFDISLRAWQVKDAQGGLTTVSLSNLVLNQPLPQNAWDFKDPRGERATRRRTR